MSVFLFLHLTTHLPRWLFSPRQIRFFGNFVTQFFFWWRNVRKLPFPEALLVLSGCQEECRPRNNNMKMIIWHHSNSASDLPPALDWGIGTVSVWRRARRKPSWRRTCRSTRCSSARPRSSHTWARRWWCWLWSQRTHSWTCCPNIFEMIMKELSIFTVGSLHFVTVSKSFTDPIREILRAENS